MDHLPVGSIVKLKASAKRMMVIGYDMRNEENKSYDYAGCLYPQGVSETSRIALFNNEDVESIVFFGFIDAEYQVLRTHLNDIKIEK